MELEAVRCVADWLKHATYGVNALLASTPRDGGDPVPASIVTIGDATRDGWAARKTTARDAATGQGYPAIAVYAEPQEFSGEVQTIVRDGEIDIVISYLDVDAATQTGNRDAMYVRRAILRSLKQLNANANAASRTRNSVTLQVCKRIRVASLNVPWDDAVLSAGVIVTYAVRDVAP